MKMVTKTQTIKKTPLRIIDCDISDYKKILQLQYRLRDQRKNSQIPNTVLILEHPDVITLGARQSANVLLADVNDIKKRNIDVINVRRGGGITAHNTGQIVFYPILNIQQLSIGINEYIRELEAIGKQLLCQLGVKSEIKKGLPGLWIDEKKIASIGVRVSKFITYHGMAINIKNDLSIFDFFVPCGLEDIEMTSVYKETGQRCSMTEVKKKLTKLLVKHFSTKELANYESYSQTA